MLFDIITIFPEAFSYLDESILKKAQHKGLIKIRIHNLRNFSFDKHKKVDDKPYGGGPGMVIKIEPLIKAIPKLKTPACRQAGKSLVILFTPAGKQFNNKVAADLAKKYQHLILICGHYEGIDERVKKILKTKEISIGPYVLTGGELPAMILIDAISRQLPEVLGKKESLEEKRLGIGVPVYTRPEVFVYKNKKYSVPKILLSGNHAEIARWRVTHRG